MGLLDLLGVAMIGILGALAVTDSKYQIVVFDAMDL
jgi:hypothetical protein